MDGFNLIPEEYQTRRGARFVPVSMLVTLAVAVLGVLLMERAVMVRASRGSGSSLAETLAVRQAELAQRCQNRLKIESDIAPLAATLSRTPVWSNVFIDVAAVMVPEVRITRWSADVERNLCSIQGNAETNAAVFELVAALEALEHFESVTLAGVAKEQDAEGHGIRYEIVCSLRQAAR